MKAKDFLPHTMPRTKTLTKSISARYKDYLKEQQQMKTVSEEQVQKTALGQGYQRFKRKQMKDSAKEMENKATTKFEKSRGKNDMTLFTQGNAIKRKSSKTTKEAQYLEETTLKELIEKRKQIN